MFQFPAQMMRVFKDEQMQAAFERSTAFIVRFGHQKQKLRN